MTSIAEIRQKYPQYDDMSDQQLADAFHKKFYSDMPQADFYSRIGFTAQPTSTGQGAAYEDYREGDKIAPYGATEVLARMLGVEKQQDDPRVHADGWSASAKADKIETWRGSGAFSDATDSILTGIPFGDEIVSGAMAPFKAGISALKGEGFDIGREYNRSMDLEAELQRRRNERSPIASTVGGVAGGLGAGGVAAKSGLTLLNGAKATLPSMAGRGMAEGAIWGGLYGAGEGRGLDERLRSAAKGSAIGGVVGGADRTNWPNGKRLSH